MKRALCIGHLSYDITLPLAGFPRENNKYQIDQALESSGGPAANAASLLALWGIDTTFLGAVGCDSYGEKALSDLQQSGVDISLVKRSKEGSTPLSIILVNTQTGSRTILNRKGGSFLSREEASTFIDSLLRNPPNLLLFDGHEPEASLAALEYFPEAISILDAGSLRRGTELLAPRVDYCIASERFAREVAGTAPCSTPLQAVSSDPPASSPAAHAYSCYRFLLTALEQRGIQYPVITLGEVGCCFLEPEDPSLHSTLPSVMFPDDAAPFPDKASQPAAVRGVLLPAYPAKAVDTTGAGDIFHGAFAGALLGGKSFREALIVATVAAGLSVERLGGRPSIPTLEEVVHAWKHWEPELVPIPIDS